MYYCTIDKRIKKFVARELEMWRWLGEEKGRCQILGPEPGTCFPTCGQARCLSAGHDLIWRKRRGVLSRIHIWQERMTPIRNQKPGQHSISVQSSEELVARRYQHSPNNPRSCAEAPSSLQ